MFWLFAFYIQGNYDYCRPVALYIYIDRENHKERIARTWYNMGTGIKD